ncbi:DUF1127 domain-containing protein [Xanthobacter dioxanivorans]|uniref:DUF1127 domain-containing protein n=2 Tax=Xanthobacter dioxanivorans TaxID=2528964 RepID=A0A974PV77_9HYPH|nr:DUF1127 domain-containing protein [Xanthobacter dioxanivorans]
MVASLCLAFVGVVGRGVKAAGAVGRAIERRSVLSQLASCDDHMLRDIGLTRSDLRDAAATPLTRDPTRMLVLRATERRTAARLAAWDRTRIGA